MQAFWTHQINFFHMHLKILQVRLQQYVNCELPDVQAGFRKHRGTRDQSLNIHWIIQKARKLLFLYWLCQSLGLCGSQQTVQNSSRNQNTRPLYLPPEKSVCRSRTKSQNSTWNNRLVPNGERNTSRLWDHCSFLLGPCACKVLFVPTKSLFLQSCVSSVIKSHCPPKSNLEQYEKAKRYDTER